jgi:hypothetical protein
MPMIVRALACVVVAIYMASMSVAMAAHSVVVLDEAVPNVSALVSDAPCPDCRTHTTVACAQACSAALPDPGLGKPTDPVLVKIDRQPLISSRLFGAALSPPITPPIP